MLKTQEVQKKQQYHISGVGDLAGGVHAGIFGTLPITSIKFKKKLHNSYGYTGVDPNNRFNQNKP